MVIRLVIDFGKLVKVVLKRRGVGKGWRDGGRGIVGLLDFVALVCVWVYFCCCSGGCLCWGFQGTRVV
jgi:hypothetical protein